MSRPIIHSSRLFLRQSLICSLFGCVKNFESNTTLARTGCGCAVKFHFKHSNTSLMIKHLSSCTSSSVEFHNVMRQYATISTRCFSSSHNQGSGDDDNDKNTKNNKDGIDKIEISQETYNPNKDPFFTKDDAYGSKVNKGLGEVERPFFDPLTQATILEDEMASDVIKEEDEEDLEPPSNCCRSGCPNCVWIDYVEKLSKKYSDPLLSREKVLKDLDGMQDQSIKAFLMMELKSRGLI